MKSVINSRTRGALCDLPRQCRPWETARRGSSVGVPVSPQQGMLTTALLVAGPSCRVWWHLWEPTDAIQMGLQIRQGSGSCVHSLCTVSSSGGPETPSCKCLSDMPKTKCFLIFSGERYKLSFLSITFYFALWKCIYAYYRRSKQKSKKKKIKMTYNSIEKDSVLISMFTAFASFFYALWP